MGRVVNIAELPKGACATGAAIVLAVVAIASSAAAQASSSRGGTTRGASRSASPAPLASSSPAPTSAAGSPSPTTATASPSPASGDPSSIAGSPGPARWSATGAPTAPNDTGEHFTLPDAIAAMGRAHPLLAVARANIHTAEFNIRAAALWTNPQAQLSWTRSIPGNFTAYDARVGYINLSFSQLIELARLPTARRNAAEYERRGVVADSLGVYRGLVFDTYTAFMSLVEATNRLAILRETADELAEAQRVVNARVANGASPHYDFSRMTVALADARAAAGDAEADGINARGNLNVAVGPEAMSLHGTPMFDLINTPPLPTLEELMNDFVRERTDIVAARHRVAEANAQVLIARRSVFQGVVLTGGIGIGGGPAAGEVMGGGMACSQCVTTAYGLPQIDATIALGFPLPFLDRGQGTIPAAEAHALALAETARALEIGARQAVTTTYNEVVHRRAALQAYIDTGAAESFAMRREAQAQYREGRIQILDLVDAYTAVRDAQLRLLSLALDARNAEINLFRAVGNVH